MRFIYLTCTSVTHVCSTYQHTTINILIHVVMVLYDEPFCEVISVSLHMSVITQDGDSALMMAVREGRTEIVTLLLKAGTNTDLQNKVRFQ